MSILIDEKTPVIFQGFTGDKATFHAKESIAYGTNVVGGVTPGKGGTLHLDRPVFNTVKEAVRATGATASIIFVPAAFCADSVMEAANAGIRLVVTITETIAGFACASGFIYFIVTQNARIAFWGFVLANCDLVMLFFGQRVSKDYVGAADLQPYFIIGMIGLLICGLRAW